MVQAAQSSVDDDITLVIAEKVKAARRASAPVLVNGIGPKKLQEIRSCGFTSAREFVNAWRPQSGEQDPKMASLITLRREANRQKDPLELIGSWVEKFHAIFAERQMSLQNAENHLSELEFTSVDGSGSDNPGVDDVQDVDDNDNGGGSDDGDGSGSDTAAGTSAGETPGVPVFSDWKDPTGSVGVNDRADPA
jgi:hypothetical protein